MKRALQAATALSEQPQRDPHGADLLRQYEICALFGISDETWRRWRQRGRTPAPVDLPGVPRWRRADVEALLERVKSNKTRQFFQTANRRVW